jgi:hypothetical protein
MLVGIDKAGSGLLPELREIVLDPRCQLGILALLPLIGNISPVATDRAIPMTASIFAITSRIFSGINMSAATPALRSAGLCVSVPNFVR